MYKIFVVFLLLLGASPALAISADEVNTAGPGPAKPVTDRIDPFTIKLQVLLDRAHFSPGAIDGRSGENLEKALVAYASAHGLEWSGKMTDVLWQRLSSNQPKNAVVQYTLTEDDVRGPFLEKVPAKMEEMKSLPALSYTSPREKIAEQFHMDEKLLSELNPSSFDRAGQTILVANAANDALPTKVARIEVDKTLQTVRAFDQANALIAYYPATVGSEEKPAPDGRLKVTQVKENPVYRYDPAYAFKGVKARHPFFIKAGPNNPVGLVWIGLSERGYGIHGTPEPTKVSKTESHGCVRLTNWDAVQLSRAVKKGVPVDFLESVPSDNAIQRPAVTQRRVKR